jgi:hypothetical protein
MSSFPGDTQAKTGRIGEGGGQDAGIRASTIVADRSRPRRPVASRVLRISDGY